MEYLSPKLRKNKKPIVSTTENKSKEKREKNRAVRFFARKTCSTEEAGATAPQRVTAVLLTKTDAVLDMFMTFLV